jgi:eukaryotic-like serine/threonine-protein kinase
MTADSLLGQTVGNYVVASFLGEGGMGQVYLAEHPQIRRRVAIKVLSSQYLQHPQAAERFLTEARAVTRIEHPNVIDIYDFGSLPDGRLYYVMEMLKGRELHRVMADKGKWTAGEIWPYLEQIAAGLQAAHDHDVVHRDLKPENIFVLDRQPLLLKLLDFGIAKLIETKQGTSITSTGMVMGTPLFIAPEQAAGQPERISPRTDLYSLGVILYWMLAGRPPFVEDTAALLIARHALVPAPSLLSVEPSVPPAIAKIVDQCLEKDPLARPNSANAVAAAWVEALGVAEHQISAHVRGGARPPTGPVRPTLLPLAAGRPTTEPSPASSGVVKTTLGQSVGEMARPTQLGLSSGRKLALVAGGAVAAVAVVVLIIWVSSSPAPTPTPAVAPGTSVKADSVPTVKKPVKTAPASQPAVHPAAPVADGKKSTKPKPASPASAPTAKRPIKKLRHAGAKPETKPEPKKDTTKSVKKTKKGWVSDPFEGQE